MPISPLSLVLFLCLILSLGMNIHQDSRLRRVPKEKYRAFRTGVLCGAAGFESRVRDDEMSSPSPLFGFDYLHTVATDVVDTESTWGEYQEALEIQAMYDSTPQKLWLRRGPGAELDAHLLAKLERRMNQTQNRPPGADTGGAS